MVLAGQTLLLVPRGQGSANFPQCNLALNAAEALSPVWADTELLDFCLFLVQRFLQGPPNLPLLCLKHQQSPPGKLPKETATSFSSVGISFSSSRLSKTNLYATIEGMLDAMHFHFARPTFQVKELQGPNKQQLQGEWKGKPTKTHDHCFSLLFLLCFGAGTGMPRSSLGCCLWHGLVGH